MRIIILESNVIIEEKKKTKILLILGNIVMELLSKNVDLGSMRRQLIVILMHVIASQVNSSQVCSAGNHVALRTQLT